MDNTNTAAIVAALTAIFAACEDALAADFLTLAHKVINRGVTADTETIGAAWDAMVVAGTIDPAHVAAVEARVYTAARPAPKTRRIDLGFVAYDCDIRSEWNDGGHYVGRSIR